MANQEQLDLLKQKVATWNQWRRGHSGRPSLSQANLRGPVLSGAPLRGAPLRTGPLRTITLLVFILNTLLVACVPLGDTSKPAPVSSQLVLQPTVNPHYACQRSKSGATLSLAGLAYSPYHTGQDPNYNIFPSAEEVAADIPTLACLTNYIRIYSSLGPAKDIVQNAEQAQMSVNLGIWLGPNANANAREIAAGIQLASNKVVRVITVGSEVLLRHDMSAADLHKTIQQVRAKLSRSGHPVQITMADDDRMWLSHPELANDVDFITVHLYPFWEHISINDAIQALDAAYKRLKQTFPHKQIVIGETGWPSDGPAQGAAVPSAANQSRYFREFIAWTKQQKEKVQYFYFDAFDETWKTKESGVGTHWGLYQEDGVVKPALSDLLPGAASATLKERSYRDVYVGSLEAGFGLGRGTSNQQGNWLTDEQGTLLLSYPANQLWGTMFITVGKPVPLGNRPSLDLSRYHSLVVDMRAGVDGQCIRLGIKDRTQPDDGSEITLQQCLTTVWSTIALPLDIFSNVDLNHVYIVFEVIFRGTSSETIELRNIRYSPAEVPSLPPQPPVPMPFNVYTEVGSPDNHYVPTGGMGDYRDITTTEDWTANPHSGRTCIQVVYSSATSRGNGWAGVYWQDPADNWGKTLGPTGYNLSNASYLSFWVRGKVGGEKVKFQVGGINARRYGDSLLPAVTTDVLTLTTSWQQITIDLRGKDLTHIIGGFAWVANTTDNPNGVTFYLDDIVYSA